jgi:hypothetical protein
VNLRGIECSWVKVDTEMGGTVTSLDGSSTKCFSHFSFHSRLFSIAISNTTTPKRRWLNKYKGDLFAWRTVHMYLFVSKDTLPSNVNDSSYGLACDHTRLAE